MLHVTIPGVELYDEVAGEFIQTKPCELQLEHSLVSLSKWESKWHKPFLVKEPHSEEEMQDYIRCMTLTQNVDPNIYKTLPASVIEQINKYIEDPMTATWFNDKKNDHPRPKEQVTSELIYWWMITLGIPFECQKWHLNRLLTLVQVCDKKNAPPKKMSLQERTALNNARRGKLGTRG